MCNNPETNKKIITTVRVAEIIAFTWGCIFATGYLIRSFYARSLGVNPISFLKSENVEVALIFILLTCIISSVPLLIVSLMRKNENPTFSEQMVYTVIFVPAYISIGAFGAIFVVGNEWDMPFLNSISFRSAYLTYMCTTFFTIVAPALLRRLDIKNKKLSRKAGDDNDSPIVKTIGVVANIITTLFTVLFLSIMVMKFDRLGCLIGKSIWYLVTVFFLVTASYTVCLFANLQPRIGMRLRVHGIGLPALILLYYAMVLSYGSGIYRMIPENRGGALPITKTKLSWEGTNTDWVCVIEETPDLIYYVPLSDIENHQLKKGIRAQAVNKNKITSFHNEQYMPYGK